MIYGIGTDIVEVKRIEQAVKRWGDSFLSHIFTPAEIAYAKQNKNPSQHLAARFAAKEAVFKAIGDKPDIRWKEIEVFNDKYGRPCCIFKKKNFKRKILISLSHTKHYAVANAIVTSKS